MKREDYFKYRIQGGDIYVLPVDIFDELFDELVNFQLENKQLREAIEKIRHILRNQMNYKDFVDIVNDIEDVMKEVE